MPLNYTELFGDLGVLIARINSYLTEAATTLPDDLATLVSQFATRWLPEEGIASYYQGLQNQVVAWRQGVAGYADSRLLDPDTVLSQLALDPGSDLDTLLPALQQAMVDGSQTVKACTCTLGAVAPPAGAVNFGNGQAFTSLTLDGINGPALSAPASVLYAGRLSQLCVPSETMLLECTADSASDGLAEGSEQWSWTGSPAYPDLDYHAEGSGTGPSLTTANGYGLVSGDFETWSGNVPAGWSLALGTAGVHLFEDTLPANVYRGSAAARFVGDGVLPMIQLSQPVSPSSLTGRQLYHLCFAVKASATNSAAQVAALMTGSSGGTIGLTIAGSQLPLTWSLASAFLLMPVNLSSDWQLQLQLSGLAAGQEVWIDSLSFAPAVYHGGVAAAVVAGQSPWLRGDRLSWTVANDGAGLFQSFFRQHYQVQLPSVLATAQGTALTLPFLLLTQTPAPTIPDSWVA